MLVFDKRTLAHYLVAAICRARCVNHGRKIWAGLYVLKPNLPSLNLQTSYRGTKCASLRLRSSFCPDASFPPRSCFFRRPIQSFVRRSLFPLILSFITSTPRLHHFFFSRVFSPVERQQQRGLRKGWGGCGGCGGCGSMSTTVITFSQPLVASFGGDHIQSSFCCLFFALYACLFTYDSLSPGCG